MAAASNVAKTLSARSLKTNDGGGIQVLSSEGTSVYMTEVMVDDHLHGNNNNNNNGNPITEKKTIIGVPRKPQTPQLEQADHSQRIPAVSPPSEPRRTQDGDLRDVAAVKRESSNGSSSSNEESKSLQGVEATLQGAGVELDLESLCLSGDGKAPLELISQFLACVMNEEFEAAKILCEKVMELEPNNEVAAQFYPVIQERIRLDDELPTESSSSESDGEIDFVSSGEDNSSSSSGSDEAEGIGTGGLVNSGVHTCTHTHKDCVHKESL